MLASRGGAPSLEQLLSLHFFFFLSGYLAVQREPLLLVTTTSYTLVKVPVGAYATYSMSHYRLGWISIPLNTEPGACAPPSWSVHSSSLYHSLLYYDCTMQCCDRN